MATELNSSTRLTEAVIASWNMGDGEADREGEQRVEERAEDKVAEEGRWRWGEQGRKVDSSRRVWPWCLVVKLGESASADGSTSVVPKVFDLNRQVRLEAGRWAEEGSLREVME